MSPPDSNFLLIQELSYKAIVHSISVGCDIGKRRRDVGGAGKWFVAVIGGGCMGVKMELRVFELLASRVCHDLIGPISAVGNGLELLEDADKEMAGDALEL